MRGMHTITALLGDSYDACYTPLPGQTRDCSLAFTGASFDGADLLIWIIVACLLVMAGLALAGKVGR